MSPEIRRLPSTRHLQNPDNMLSDESLSCPTGTLVPRVSESLNSLRTISDSRITIYYPPRCFLRIQLSRLNKSSRRRC